MRTTVDTAINPRRATREQPRSAARRRCAGHKPTTAEKVEIALIRDIREQVYPPGTSLREERMSAKYGASRTIIRTVLIRLAAEGYVELHPWRGAFITRYSYGELADLMDLHILLVSFIARRAAVRRSPDDLRTLEATLHRLEDAKDDEACSRFHLLRIELLEVLLQAAAPLDSALRRAAMSAQFHHQHCLADIVDREARRRQVEYYRKALAALAEQDPMGASQHLSIILQEGRQAVLQAEKATRPQTP